MFDTARRVKPVKSIAQMPVILGVRRSKAQALGWIGAKVTTKDILAAVEARQAEIPDDVGDAVEFRRRRLSRDAGGRHRQARPDRGRRSRQGRGAGDGARLAARASSASSGSSGWLADLYRDGERTGARYQAMWNYEAVIKETNDKLDRRQRRSRFMRSIPRTACRSPTRRSALSSAAAARRSRPSSTICRPSCSSGETPGADRRDRPARRARPRGAARRPTPTTNLDPARPLTVVRPPEPAVIQKALAIYQEALRRPSLDRAVPRRLRQHAGRRRKQLLDAMRFLFTPARTREVLVQWSKRDQIIVHAVQRSRASGRRKARAASDEQARPARARRCSWRANGGTDFYTCGAQALAAMKPMLEGRPASAGHRHHDRRQEPGRDDDVRTAVARRRAARAGVRRHLRRRAPTAASSTRWPS